MPDDFLSAADKSSDLKRIEMRIRDEQAPTYLEWFGPFTSGIEYEAVVGHLAPEKGECIGDFGCGIGRFTLELAGSCRCVIAVDYSLHSLLALRREAARRGIRNILTIQADITQLRLARGVCNKIVSSQVLTFLPGEAERRRAAECIASALADDGRLVVTVFNNHLYRRAKRVLGVPGVVEKEGTHPAHGFYYFNFGAAELRGFLKEAGFRVDAIRGLCLFPREYVKGMTPRGVGRFVYALERLLNRSWLSWWLGDLLLASATRLPRTRR